MARPKQDLADFVKMYSNVKVPFWFQTRFEDVDAAKLQALKGVGCYRISFGLEHGNEKYRKEKLYRKISNEKILHKAEVVAQSGIPYTLNIIVGFPYETRELLFESIEFIRQIKGYDALSVNVFVPYHGTVLRTMALKEGWLDPERQTTSVIAESILDMPPPYISSGEILGLQRTFPLYAKLPESRWAEIRKAEKNDVEGKAAFDLLAKEFYEMTYGMDEENRMLTYAG
jgi:anaerobic magnesium-protoporphyrin IX monomethyl ester cyclase